MKRLTARIALFVSVLIALPFNAFAWNIPGHMLSGAIAYQVLRQKSPTTMPAIRVALEKNP